MLYFVATPIGNLKDITYRAIETINNVDVIACEDTRKTSILLNHYNIKKRLIAYHKNNEFNSATGIIELLQSGKNVAVVSDAGMPVISDPGNILAKKLIEHNLEFTILPGASAGLSALVLSGFDATKFSFVGFLPEKNKERNNLLNEVKNYHSTLIFYLSPHNLTKDILEIGKILGNRKACLVKEITKIFETTIHFSLQNIPEIEAKGEYVLIIEGSASVNNLTNLTLEEQINFYMETGLTKKEALKRVAKENKIKNIYNELD